MIRWVRTALVAPGRLAEATAFAKDICAYVESVTGTKVNYFMQQGGSYGRVCWQSDFENLGDYEKQFGRLQADAGFGEKVAKAGTDSLFLPGHARDSLWSQL